MDNKSMGPHADEPAVSVDPPDPGRPEDDLLAITGGNGPWQRRFFFTLFLLMIPHLAIDMSMTFLSPAMVFWCAKPPQVANVSDEEWREFGLPAGDGMCQRYEDLSAVLQKMHQNGTTVPCSAWEYDHSFYRSTLTSEWNLVCEQEWLISLSKSVYMFGCLVGAVLSGTLADKFGRRSIAVANIFLATLSSAACAFSSSYTIFIIFRFILAVAFKGYIDVLFVLLMEVLDPSIRISYAIAAATGYGVGMVILPGVAWLVRDWRRLQLVFTALVAVFLVSCWVISESPRWLLSKGKVTEAKAVIIKAARANGKDISGIDEKLTQLMTKATEKCEEKGGTILDLFRTPALRQTTSILFFGCLTACFIFYGLFFNTNDWFGDPLVNFSVAGALNLATGLLMILVVLRSGRRLRLVALPLVLSALLCLVSAVIPHDTVFSVILAQATFQCIFCSTTTLRVYASEVLPTVLRATGLGWASVFDMVGSVLAPFVHEIGVYVATFVPSLIFGAMGLICGLLFLTLMPETQDIPIPDFVSEAGKVSGENANGSSVDRNSTLREPTAKDERC